MNTTGELDAKYGSQILEAYGPDERGRLTPGNRWPVLVCAFVTTIGWIVALSPIGTGFRPSAAGDVLRSLIPQPTPLVFGFLGVYFFSLRTIARRYTRGDLKPKAYTDIMVRIFIVAVLSWVLQAIYSGESVTMLVLAFLFGVTPDEFFTWLRESTRGKVPEGVVPVPTLPLTALEGIDIYDLNRLENEGVVNIESLAHHEIVDLIIETRIPVARLIDWIDQAILYLHLSAGGDGTARATLRGYGIRTATDLLSTWDKAESRGELEEFKQLLGGKAAPYRLEVIRDALSDDEWMKLIRNWREAAERPVMRLDAFPSTADALNTRADQEYAHGRYTLALGFLKKALQTQDSAETRRRLARFLAISPALELRDPARAHEHADQAFTMAPDDYEGLVDLVQTYTELNDQATARAMYERALAIVDAMPASDAKREQKERLKNLQPPAVSGGGGVLTTP